MIRSEKLLEREGVGDCCCSSQVEKEEEEEEEEEVIQHTGYERKVGVVSKRMRWK